MTADDIRFVLDRLDKDHVRDLADAARSHWDASTAGFELCYQPGDGTHYALVFTIADDDRQPLIGAPGGGTVGMPPSSGLPFPRDRSYTIVYYVQRNRGMLLGRHEFVHPGLLDLDVGPASTLALAVLLNAITVPGDERWKNSLIEAAEAAEARA